MLAEIEAAGVPGMVNEPRWRINKREREREQYHEKKLAKIDEIVDETSQKEVPPHPPKKNYIYTHTRKPTKPALPLDVQDFEQRLWLPYPKRPSRGTKSKAIEAWRGLSETERDDAVACLPLYAKTVSEPKFLLDAERYLKHRRFEEFAEQIRLDRDAAEVKARKAEQHRAEKKRLLLNALNEEFRANHGAYKEIWDRRGPAGFQEGDQREFAEQYFGQVKREAAE
jgi:hypothetical protein